MGLLPGWGTHRDNQSMSLSQINKQSLGVDLKENTRPCCGVGTDGLVTRPSSFQQTFAGYLLHQNPCQTHLHWVSHLVLHKNPGEVIIFTFTRKKIVSEKLSNLSLVEFKPYCLRNRILSLKNCNM